MLVSGCANLAGRLLLVVPMNTGKSVRIILSNASDAWSYLSVFMSGSGLGYARICAATSKLLCLYCNPYQEPNIHALTLWLLLSQLSTKKGILFICPSIVSIHSKVRYVFLCKSLRLLVRCPKKRGC